MVDREKVIKGLECCMKWTGEPNTATCHCSDCSYTNIDVLGERCLIDLINDALALLKEQNSCVKLLNERDYIVHYTGDGLQLLPDVMQELVRCKDCKHSEHWYGDKSRCSLWHETGIDVFNDGFCNYGEHT